MRFNVQACEHAVDSALHELCHVVGILRHHKQCWEADHQGSDDRSEDHGGADGGASADTKDISKQLRQDRILNKSTHLKAKAGSLRESIVGILAKEGITQREMFLRLDKDHGGTLDRSEFLGGLRQLGIPLSVDDMNMLWPMFSHDADGTVGKHEWEKFLDPKGFESWWSYGNSSPTLVSQRLACAAAVNGAAIEAAAGAARAVRRAAAAEEEAAAAAAAAAALVAAATSGNGKGKRGNRRGSSGGSSGVAVPAAAEAGGAVAADAGGAAAGSAAHRPPSARQVTDSPTALYRTATH